MTKRQIGFGDWKPAKNLKKYLNNILKTRRLTYGPYCKRLEDEFTKINGAKYSIFCSSGTAALYTALAVLKQQNPEMAEKRKYVVMPATTFISALNVIVANGFEPLFVDVAANYNIAYNDLESVLRTHGNKVFAVMPASLMGRPIDGLRIKDAINNYAEGAYFILDSCENIASKFDGQFPESLADFTAWSSYLSHLLISGAVGGFIGTNSEKLAIASRSFINHGRSPEYMSIDDDNNVNEATLKDITAKRFKFVRSGQNFRMGEMEAAVALSMLEDDFEGQLKKREQNSLYLIRELSRFELILPKFIPEEINRHMMLPCRVCKGTKWDLVNHLESLGVETRDILPLAGQPITEKYFGDMLKFRTDFPMSFEIYEKGFYLGTHNHLTQDDLDYMVKGFESFFKK